MKVGRLVAHRAHDEIPSTEVRLKADTTEDVRLKADTTEDVRLKADTTEEVRLKAADNTEGPPRSSFEKHR